MSTRKQDSSHIHYQTIKKAIAFIRSHHLEQPSLETISQYVGLSPCHLQRVFSKWAGISPKQFLQFLNKEHAKQLLTNHSVLDSSLATGLSSTSRLHDLMIRTEAVTPGEIKSLGKNLLIETGYHETPFGQCIIAQTPRGICKLAFYDNAQQKTAIEQALQTQWAQAQHVKNQCTTAKTLAQIFNIDSNKKQPLHLLLKGSAFQLKVWEALLNIPSGHLVSYQSIAQQIKQPSASRATASAIANNDIAWLIPCHRVIRSTGEFNQYRWGAERKQAMHVWERGQRNQQNQ